VLVFGDHPLSQLVCDGQCLFQPEGMALFVGQVFFPCLSLDDIEFLDLAEGTCRPCRVVVLDLLEVSAYLGHADDPDNLLVARQCGIIGLVAVGL